MSSENEIINDSIINLVDNVNIDNKDVYIEPRGAERKALTKLIKSAEFTKKGILVNGETEILFTDDMLATELGHALHLWLRDGNKPSPKPLDESDIYAKLTALCSSKSQDAKNYIAGIKVTSDQLERYKRKYELAKAFKAGNTDVGNKLQLEATLNGIEVDQLADLIIAKGDAYQDALDAFNDKIEAFRTRVSDLIKDGELEKADALIEVARGFDASTSDADIQAAFDSILNA